jgi:hypothetical protein
MRYSVFYVVGKEIVEFVVTNDYYEAHKIEIELKDAGHDAWIADGLLELMVG